MDLLQIEQQRQALEDNVAKLRKTLKHWQRSEAEYEGLKEEILAVDEPLSVDTLTEIAKSYNGDVVDEKEINDITGLGTGSPRSKPQILGMIARRQEYNQKNIDDISKQYFVAEGKLEEFAFASAWGSAEAGGLPLTEIHEELDEEGNVLSSRLSQPESATSKIVDGLRKAGLTEDDLSTSQPPDDDEKPATAPPKSALTNAIPAMSPDRRGKTTGDLSAATAGAADDDHVDYPERPSIRKKSVSFTADTKPPPDKPRSVSRDGSKKVTFAEKVAIARAADPPDPRSVSFSPKIEEIPSKPLGPSSPEAKPESGVQKDLRASFKPGEKVYELNDDYEATASHVVLPEKESEEDARIRREMLDYHLNEVGNVVAQLDLEEGDGETDIDEMSTSGWTSSDHPEGEEDTPYTSDMSESEDEEDDFGRTKRRVVSEEYRKEMEALQQKLIGNMGPTPDDEDIEAADPNLNPQDVRRLVIRNKSDSVSSAASSSSDVEKKSSSKKRVSFAEAPDVADPDSPPTKAQKHSEGENVAPLAEAVMERSTAMAHSMPGHAPTNRGSRFKQRRASQPAYSDDPDAKAVTLGAGLDGTDEDDMHDTPTGPPGRTLVDTLKERTPTSSRSVAPPSADEPDAVLARRELAADYYRRRNDLIKQQGGFKADDEEELGELMEERDGKVKKVSRFKAARIKS